MTLKGALMRLTANSARSVKQIIHGQQIMNGAVMIHSNTPTTDSRKATSMNGKPMRNPSGLQLSHILPPAQYLVTPAESATTSTCMAERSILQADANFCKDGITQITTILLQTNFLFRKHTAHQFLARYNRVLSSDTANLLCLHLDVTHRLS